MPPIVVDRQTGLQEEEAVFGEDALTFVYGDTFLAKIVGRLLLHLLIKTAFFARLYGFWQKTSLSKRKIRPFIDKFAIDTSEFLDDVATFASFDAFFTRKLKPWIRPITPDARRAIIPADGRYRFFPNIAQADGFLIKGEKFSLSSLLGDAALAGRYEEGSMVIARLCPTDYHRYHFPCDCTPSESRLINGWLYSVNPIATKQNIHIFTQNKRTICELHTKEFGRILFVEIGATCVGSITQTYQSTYPPLQFYKKGDEKGFFSFGASSIVLLFEPDCIRFDADLLELSADYLEVKCLMGQSLGSFL